MDACSCSNLRSGDRWGYGNVGFELRPRAAKASHHSEWYLKRCRVACAYGSGERNGMEQAGARTMQVGVGRGAQRGVEGDALARCDVLLLLPFFR